MPLDQFESTTRLTTVWAQEAFSVIRRRDGSGERPRLRLPFDRSNRAWLRNGRRTDPNWIEGEQCWEFPSAWFDNTIERALNRFGRLYVIQPFNVREVCAPACRNAAGQACSCSCGGKHHGMTGGVGWFDVSDTFSLRWQGKALACRLLTLR